MLRDINIMNEKLSMPHGNHVFIDKPNEPPNNDIRCNNLEGMLYY